MAKNNQQEEPKPDRWYNITLGSSFKDPTNASSKFFTLRYEFKPASIDKSQPGTLHKGKDNMVTVEYQNNQPGKPKVSFEGVCEDYKDNDAVLFFDGEGFRLERLHRAVKRLRHIRLPGESAAAVPLVDSFAKGGGGPTRPPQVVSKGVSHPLPVQVEQINIGGLENLESKDEKHVENRSVPPNPSASLDFKNYDSEEHIDVIDNDDQVNGAANAGNASEKGLRVGLDIDINLPHQADADDVVDISDEEADRGPNAAEALRAQVNAEVRKEQSSSSTSSSGSDSSRSDNGSESGTGSGSGSGSSSSESESSDGDSDVSV